MVSVSFYRFAKKPSFLIPTRLNCLKYKGVKSFPNLYLDDLVVMSNQIYSFQVDTLILKVLTLRKLSQ